EQSQIAKMQQEQKWVVAGDMLFPEGGYQLTANGKQAHSQYVPRLQALQNAKFVVYGYTDNLSVGPTLQRAGIANNIDLYSRPAASGSTKMPSPIWISQPSPPPPGTEPSPNGR